MLLNLNDTGYMGDKFMKFLFPDNQPHIKLLVGDYEPVDVRCSIMDSKTLLELLLMSNALKEKRIRKRNLYIPYLMGARSDRVMKPGDSFDLRVIADMINYCDFELVHLWDPHSEMASILINNAIVHSNRFMVRSYTIPNSVLIIPDTGAAKKAPSYFEWDKNLVDSVQCVKNTDPHTGALSIRVLEADRCTDKPCVIIDDICDGGGSFVAIANQIKPSHLTLIVTHGIFSGGFGDLSKAFNEIIVSDSRPINGFPDNFLKIIKIYET